MRTASKQCTKPDFSELDPAEVEQKAKECVLRILGSRAYSCAEVRQKLAQRGFPAEIAERAVNAIRNLGYLDDEQFARDYVRYKGGQLGRNRLVQELSAKGIAKNIQEQVLAQVDEAEEAKKVRTLVEKRLAGMAGLPRETQIRRLAGYLARRGFAMSLVMRTVNEAIDQKEAEDG